LKGRLRKNAKMHAVPWKSGASAPRKAPAINEALAPVVASCVHEEFFLSLFHRVVNVSKPIPASAVAGRVFKTQAPQRRILRTAILRVLPRFFP